MPRKPKINCRAFGCNELIEAGAEYCPKHSKKRNERNGVMRHKQKESFYGSDSWARARASKLSTDPLCERCLRLGRLTTATLVHHKETVKDTPELSLIHDNFESLCHRCHAIEHGQTGTFLQKRT